MIIEYDKHSLIIDNKKVVINSAAFHYFRCPGEKTWRDRLSKIKACGYNTVDLYFCWGVHSQKPGSYDFTGIRDIKALLDLTAELGLFVVARPGPFINAELSFGGLPLWLLNIPDIIIRNKQNGDFVYSESFMTALKEWYSQIIPILNEYQNIIAFQVENEYYTNEAEPDYILELYDLARSMGVKAPIFHNDALSVGMYSDIVDIYAFDTYPTINLNYDWRKFPDAFGVLDNAESNLGGYCENSPLYIAELQAGWFDKWGGIGYENIRGQFKKEYINIVTKTALSQGITMFNHYMGCGGTSWGNLASSEVYTSYDFAAPISESGIPGENYYKAKEINYLLNAFNFASTDLISQGEEIFGCEKNIFAKLRKDNLNDCNWLFVRNLNEETKNLKFSEKYNLTIKPFDMKILPVDLNLNSCKILFSSMEIFGRVENSGHNHEILFFIIDENSEIFISDFSSCSLPADCHCEGAKPLCLLCKSSFSLPAYCHCEEGLCPDVAIYPIKSADLNDSDSFKFTKNGKITEFIFITPKTADKTWIFNNKVVTGPEFLTDNRQKAAFSQDTEIKILDSEMNFKTEKIKISQEENLLELTDWRVFNCSPEIDLNYDYSGWNLLKDGDKPDCISNKIYEDYIWYKTAFKELPKKIEINAKHCYAVYLNGHQIYEHDSFLFEHGNEISETMTFEIDKNYSSESDENQITVLVQNMGFDKGFQNELILPRGILSLKTIPEQSLDLKIKGGLTSFDEENSENLSENSYLIRLIAKFKIKENIDIFQPLVLDLAEAEFNKADIYLNGILAGKFWKSKGPQTEFYLPEEFLKPENTLSLLIWDRENNTQNYKDYKSKQQYVKIKIRHIKTFNLVCLNNPG